MRDQKQREELIQKHLIERQNLQAQFNLLRQNYEEERSKLIHNLSHITGKDNTERDLISNQRPNQSQKRFPNFGPNSQEPDI